MRKLSIGMAAGLLVVATLLANGAWDDRAPSTNAQGDDAAVVRDVAERLFASTYASTLMGERSGARLLVGQLPAGFPFDLPLPPDGRVLGSVERTAGERRTSIEVAVEAPGTPSSILAFYDRAFPAAGWYVPPSVATGGGFQPATGKRLDLYCLGEDGPWINMTASERGQGMNDVRVSVSFPSSQSTTPDPRYRGPCSLESYSPSTAMSAARLVPRLSGPPGLQLQSSGVGYSGDGSSSATATTSMSVVDLELLFARQLEEGGWTRKQRGADGPLAWSTWTLPAGAEWQGFLYVIELPGESRRHLSLQVQSATSPASPGMPYYPTILGEDRNG